MPKKNRVVLSAAERRELIKLIRAGRSPSRKLTRARIVLKADEKEDGWTDAQISKPLDVGIRMIENVRKRFAEGGVGFAIERRPQPARPQKRKIDGTNEAQLTMLACGAAPEGHARWSLNLLAGSMIELKFVDTVSYETVRNALKKSELKPWLKQQWCIPPKQNAEFVTRAGTTGILDVYQRPLDPKRPVVCVDEKSKQLVADVRDPLPPEPGKPARQDYEYNRQGTANLFVARGGFACTLSNRCRAGVGST